MFLVHLYNHLKNPPEKFFLGKIMIFIVTPALSSLATVPMQIKHCFYIENN